MPTLKENKLYEILETRRDEWSEYYKAYILPLAHNMTPFLENIKHFFPEYPDHGIQHSYRILHYIGSIISEEIINELSSLDLVVLFFAALFHDSGMALFNADDIEKEIIRKEHPQKAKEVIDQYFEKNLQDMSEHERIKNAVIFVCEAHGFQLEELIKDKRFKKEDRVNTLYIHYGILAFLLRIGDLMDLEAERVNNFRMMMFSDGFYGLSKAHNERHQNVELYAYDQEKLDIEVIADDTTQYMIWDDWFTYLKEDIEKFNTLYTRKRLYLPNPKTQIKTPEGADYVVQKMRFEIDDKGGMWDIIAKSIYTNELDYVRELLQNAIDASLKTVYLDSKKELKYVSPRAWGEKAKEILVCYSEKENILCVIDHGIGMNNDDLENYLFKVSNSGKVYNPKRSFEFPGIAQFGIGFISCLVNADTIRIYTSRNGKKLYKASMENDRTYAFIETLDNEDNYKGTTVVLKIRHGIETKKMQDYVLKTFGFSSVKIKFVDTDSLLEKVQKKNEAETKRILQDEPYKFDMILEECNNDDLKLLSELDNNQKALLEVLKDNTVLYEFYKNGGNQKIFYESVLSLPDFSAAWEETEGEKEKIFEELKNIYLKSPMQNKIEFDDISDFYKNDYLANKYIFTNLWRSLQKQIDEYTNPMINVGESLLNTNEDNEYLIAYINAKMEIEDIIQTKEPVSLRKKTGFVFIQHTECNYDAGIEYAATNGFFFYRGKVYDRIVKIKRTYNVNHPNHNFKDYCIGISGNADSIQDIVAQYLSETRKEVTGTKEYREIEAAKREIGRLSFDKRYEELKITDNQKLYSLERATRQFLSKKSIKRFVFTDEDWQKAMLFARKINGSRMLAFYQDGIGINNSLNSLFPLGFFRIVCNCTANARMKLNISRHAPSEIHSDIKQWMEDTGGKIQQMILKNLEKAWKALDLEMDYTIAFGKGHANSGIFEEEAKQSLKRILTNRGKYHDPESHFYVAPYSKSIYEDEKDRDDRFETIALDPLYDEENTFEDDDFIL